MFCCALLWCEPTIQAFSCPHCHERNSEVQFAGVVGEKGRKYILDVAEGDLRALNRQVVKSDYATLKVPELEFEIESGTQKVREKNPRRKRSIAAPVPVSRGQLQSNAW